MKIEIVTLILKILIPLFVLCIIMAILLAIPKKDQHNGQNKTYVDEIRVLTIDGDTAIINRGIGTTMTIEIK
jgi:hypothetical protein